LTPPVNPFPKESIMVRGNAGIAVFLILVLAAPAVSAQTQMSKGTGSNRKLIEEVRHRLVLLPYYNVFDNLSFTVEENTVVLTGQVVRASLKSDAESAVRRLEGVNKVANEIEVLPLSPTDDRLRIALYRAIYGSEPLQVKYAVRSVPPIHIIVNNGQISLEGVVDSQSDKALIGIVANGVPEVFSVKNNLRVQER
jgi:hyperosmotically inducible periplasmic protein